MNRTSDRMSDELWIPVVLRICYEIPVVLRICYEIPVVLRIDAIAAFFNAKIFITAKHCN